MLSDISINQEEKVGLEQLLWAQSWGAGEGHGRAKTHLFSTLSARHTPLTREATLLEVSLCPSGFPAKRRCPVQINVQHPWLGYGQGQRPWFPFWYPTCVHTLSQHRPSRCACTLPTQDHNSSLLAHTRTSCICSGLDVIQVG